MTFPARQIPIVAPQLRTLESIATIGVHTIPTARSAATDIDPDRLRLVNGRLDLATLASYRPIFDRLATETRAVRAELARLPRTWLLPPLEHQLARFETTVARADDSAQTADEAVAAAPFILGGSGTRTYLVAFVTPAEARGSGGLMANYGVLTATDGRLHLGRVGRGPSLDRAGTQPKHLTGPPDYLARYGKFEPAQTWENVTMSPDFPSVGDVMAQLYPQSGGVAIDGVIEVDPFAMARLISLSGPVNIPGVPVTVNANNAVSFLFRDQYTLITDPIERADLLGDLARAVFDKLTSGHSARPATIAQALSPAIATEDLALWFGNDRSQAFARRIGADAALPPVDGDSFGVIVQNAGGNKIDYYLQRRSGTRRRSPPPDTSTPMRSSRCATTHRATGVPLYVIGNGLGKPVGTNTLYLSLYSPLALETANIDGRPIDLLSETRAREERVLVVRRHSTRRHADDHCRPRRHDRRLLGHLSLRRPRADAAEPRPDPVVGPHTRRARRRSLGRTARCRSRSASDRVPPPSRAPPSAARGASTCDCDDEGRRSDRRRGVTEPIAVTEPYWYVVMPNSSRILIAPRSSASLTDCFHRPTRCSRSPVARICPTFSFEIRDERDGSARRANMRSGSARSSDFASRATVASGWSTHSS